MDFHETLYGGQQNRSRRSCDCLIWINLKGTYNGIHSGFEYLHSMLRNASQKATLYRPHSFLRTLRTVALSEKYPSLRCFASCSRHILQSFPRKHSQRHRFSSRHSLVLKDDNIYALSTAPGRAGIAIVRISGPSCLAVSSFVRQSRLF